MFEKLMRYIRGKIHNKNINDITSTGIKKVLILYSPDTMGKNQSWEMTFEETAYAEAIFQGIYTYNENKVFQKTSIYDIVEMKCVSDNFAFLKAIEMFSKQNGHIDKLIVCSHMWEYGINLLYEDNDDETYVRIENIIAYPDKPKINSIKLCGCNAGRVIDENKNCIAQDMANYYGCSVEASTSSTWCAMDGWVYDKWDNKRVLFKPTNRWLIRLTPSNGKSIKHRKV